MSVFAGANKYGQLGRGDKYDTGDDPDEMGDNLVKVDLGSGEVPVDIALAEEHSCVVLKSGETKVGAGAVYKEGGAMLHICCPLSHLTQTWVFCWFRFWAPCAICINSAAVMPLYLVSTGTHIT